MESVPRLTDRDREILQVLTHRVRTLSVAQVATGWWGTGKASEDASRRRLGTLESAGFLRSRRVFAHPDLELKAPLVTWQLGRPRPEFGMLAYALLSRWAGPGTYQTIVAASARTGNWLGGSGGRLPRTSEMSHDISLAGIYLRLRRESPGMAAGWTSEAKLYARGWGRGARLPDVLIEGYGSPTVLELAGKYSKSKLEAFHAFCEEEALAYELW